jgi:hypothetical protein
MARLPPHAQKLRLRVGRRPSEAALAHDRDAADWKLGENLKRPGPAAPAEGGRPAAAGGHPPGARYLCPSRPWLDKPVARALHLVESAPVSVGDSDPAPGPGPQAPPGRRHGPSSGCSILPAKRRAISRDPRRLPPESALTRMRVVSGNLKRQPGRAAAAAERSSGLWPAGRARAQCRRLLFRS